MALCVLQCIGQRGANETRFVFHTVENVTDKVTISIAVFVSFETHKALKNCNRLMLQRQNKMAILLCFLKIQTIIVL